MGARSGGGAAIAGVSVPPTGPPRVFRYRPTRMGDQVQLAVACLTALAGVLLLLAVPIIIFILLELHDLHWSLGGVLAISGGMHFALSLAVLWGAIQAY